MPTARAGDRSRSMTVPRMTGSHRGIPMGRAYFSPDMSGFRTRHGTRQQRFIRSMWGYKQGHCRPYSDTGLAVPVCSIPPVSQELPITWSKFRPAGLVDMALPTHSLFFTSIILLSLHSNECNAGRSELMCCLPRGFARAPARVIDPAFACLPLQASMRTLLAVFSRRSVIPALRVTPPLFTPQYRGRKLRNEEPDQKGIP